MIFDLYTYIYCEVIVRPQSALRVQATMMVPGWWPAHYAAAPLLDGLTAPYRRTCSNHANCGNLNAFCSMQPWRSTPRLPRAVLTFGVLYIFIVSLLIVALSWNRYIWHRIHNSNASQTHTTRADTLSKKVRVFDRLRMVVVVACGRLGMGHICQIEHTSNHTSCRSYICVNANEEMPRVALKNSGGTSAALETTTRVHDTVFVFLSHDIRDIIIVVTSLWCCITCAAT